MPAVPNPTHKFDERHHVELPLLRHLASIGYTVIDLDVNVGNDYAATGRNADFRQTHLPGVLRDSIQALNPWLAPDQLDQVISELLRFPAASLIQNNQTAQQRLLDGIVVSENRQTGAKSPTVRLLDFDGLDHGHDRRGLNQFHAVCQFKVRVPGSATAEHIRPDIVLFVNGLALVVIECKSPKVQEPIDDAIKQMLRYAGQRGYQSEGNPDLFLFNLLIVATCRTEAVFGTITTSLRKHFHGWTDPYPVALDDVPHEGVAGPPNQQERLTHGLLMPAHLLRILRSFSIYQTDDRGQMVKVVARYQQYRAVQETIKRLRTGNTPAQRGGLIWHTQGSGKSLTMMFLVRELYRQEAALRGHKIVFVTDRTDLEDQLHGTSTVLGYPVEVANSVRELQEMLKVSSSDVVMAMIQKFQETEQQAIFPVLNTDSHILILTDEAHRSQFKSLGANLDRALPNATWVGFTGTPTEKTDHKYQHYIDKYTMRQSILDGTTLRIVYEGRTHEAQLTDHAAAEGKFADVFSEYELGEKLHILGYATRQAYLEAIPVIRAKARDMLRHFATQVLPSGFKGQLVATSREAAIRYYEAIQEELPILVAELEADNPTNVPLDRLRALRAAVVISAGDHNEPPRIKAHTTKAPQKAAVAGFKKPFPDPEAKPDPEADANIGLLIVNNMLLTGFDAPIEQVLYLDRVIKAHNLLQTIARVNRVHSADKVNGFIVDYVGLGHHLNEALETYDEREKQDIIENLSTLDQELADLKTAHQEVLDLLDHAGLTDLSDLDAFYDLFYDEDLRFEFTTAFQKFSSALNALYPHKEALDYKPAFEELAAINVMAGRHFQDQRMSLRGIPEKLRAIVDEYLTSLGVTTKVEPLSITDEGFEQQFAHLRTTKAKAAGIEHAIRHHIDVSLSQDPVLYASFAEALNQILQANADNWEEIYRLLEALRNKIKNKDQEPTYGLRPRSEMPTFRILRSELIGAGADAPTEDQISGLVTLTQQLVHHFRTELSLSVFWDNIPAQNRLRTELTDTIISAEHRATFPNAFAQRKEITTRLLEYARLNPDAIRSDA